MKINKDLRQLVKHAKLFSEGKHDRRVNAVSAWSNGEKLHVSNYHYCHASMDGTYHEGMIPKVLFSQVQNNVVDWEHIKVYFEWLFNYSPFAPCFFTKSAKSALDKRVIALDPEQPSNLIGGALIATRLGTERYQSEYRIPARLIMWHRLVELGVHPSLSFTLSHVPSFPKINGENLHIKDVVDVNWEDYYVGHEALSPLTSVTLYNPDGGYRPLTNGLITHANFFNNHQPGVHNKSFREFKKRTGSSYLWIGEEGAPKFNVNEFISQELKKELKPAIKGSTNPFAKAKLGPDSNNTNMHPFNEAMEVIAKVSPTIIKEL